MRGSNEHELAWAHKIHKQVFFVLKIITAKSFSALVLNDVEYVKVHLSRNLTPSTSTHYLEQRLEIIQHLGLCMPQWQMSLLTAMGIHQCLLADGSYR
jgi:hypothetical protein